MRKLLLPLLVLSLTACGKAADTPNGDSSAASVPDVTIAAKGYFDGTDSTLWMQLNDGCKDEVASGKRGDMCAAFDAANKEVARLMQQNPTGFRGAQVKLN